MFPQQFLKEFVFPHTANYALSSMLVDLARDTIESDQFVLLIGDSAFSVRFDLALPQCIDEIQEVWMRGPCTMNRNALLSCASSMNNAFPQRWDVNGASTV